MFTIGTIRLEYCIPLFKPLAITIKGKGGKLVSKEGRKEERVRREGGKGREEAVEGMIEKERTRGNGRKIDF